MNIGLLEDNERTQLTDKVADLSEGRPGNLIAVIPRFHLMRIETHAIPIEYAYRVVRYCELSAWVENPALIIQLLRKFDYEQIFKDAILRLKNTEPFKFFNGGRVWDSFLLALDLPFLDRLATRRAIEGFSAMLDQMAEPRPVRVLLVKGPLKSGKSFTFEYLRYVNSIFAQLNFNTIVVDYRKHAGAQFGPLDLVIQLLTQVNENWTTEVELPGAENQQNSRWLLQLVQMLTDQIRNKNYAAGVTLKTVIILDNFNEPGVPRMTLDLIQVLSSVATGQTATEPNDDLVRLIVLGLEETLPNYRNLIRIEDIKPISETDLVNYFTAYATYKSIVLPEPLALALARKIDLAELEGNPDRTRIIAAQALTIAHAVFETTAERRGEGNP